MSTVHCTLVAKCEGRGLGEAVARCPGVIPGDEAEKRHPEKGCSESMCHDLQPLRPMCARSRTPSNEPENASANQIQPWTLPVEMPEKNAPTLQPKANRAL